MKKLFIQGCLLVILSFAASAQDAGKFIPLFNGKNLSGWTMAKTGGFEVINGEMESRSYGAGTDIFTDKKYGNFILRLEFLLSKVGNSGVFIRMDPVIKESGFEVQLLAPWTPYRDDLHCTGSMYGHVAVKNRPDETTGKWYRMEIVCDRNVITVSIDDKMVTVADIDTVKTMAGKPYTGFIGFQGNHSDKGEFVKLRNISIRNLDSEPAYVLKGFAEKNDQRRFQAQDAAAAIGPVIIPSLSELMAGDDPYQRSGAKQVIFDIVARASAPDTTAEIRKEVTDELKESIEKSSSDIVRNYLKWLAGLID
jgi:hypothetical protein